MREEEEGKKEREEKRERRGGLRRCAWRSCSRRGSEAVGRENDDCGGEGVGFEAYATMEADARRSGSATVGAGQWSVVVAVVMRGRRRTSLLQFHGGPNLTVEECGSSILQA